MMDHLEHKSAIKSTGKDCDQVRHLRSGMKGLIIMFVVSLHILKLSRLLTL